ncbi:glycoside hydrolase family 2 protein [Amycolatopsis jejuensis]|uniref:glycoside hydrolase family 2 protein n=1 Tax=Amycolatopsis jejuensis TaxID=330084 RepID=UPI0006924331|nr:sugar-binding domain-containing protein [Amycolatopsis jejuensis]
MLLTRECSLHLDGFELIGTESASSPANLPAEGWIPAVVPGGVHESLLAAGQIEHPYWNRNEDDIRWIEERDWWFRTSFAAPTTDASDRARLIFHGLDTVADVWLNGKHLGHHENMFRPAIFEVTTLLREHNDLLVRFAPPLAGRTTPEVFTRMAERLTAAFEGSAGDLSDGETPAMFSVLPRASRIRKAAFSWGWDFGPRVPSIGLWRPVELSVQRAAVITGHHVRTDRLGPDGSAELTLRVEVDAFAAGEPLTARAKLTSPAGRTTIVELPVEAGVAAGPVTIPDAELWWTHDLGEPARYDLAVGLHAGDTVLDRITDRVGLRIITLDRSPDPEGGRLFRFILNGVPIFARGANWLPADMLVGSVTAERHHDLVGLARAAGMTMLRVWGGGVYEHDSFYQACDELGILIWHDFMFACIVYPSDDPVLLDEVAKEAEYQVKRLRNHPSMALWCGNNEVELLYTAAYQHNEPGPWGHRFFHETLPAAVATHDPATPYWPGSPWGEGPAAVNGDGDGDRHAWEVWHGNLFAPGESRFASLGESRHYRRYADDNAKFVSEFGIHAAPELSTLRRWLPADALTVHSTAFDHHNKDQPKDKHEAILDIVTGLPDTIEQYIAYTMVSQAEGLKFGVEHYRRRQPHCSGTLVWQFNDVWPGFSWSVLDHELAPKAAYHYLARAYAPVLASYRRNGDQLELWITNNSRDPVTTRARITLSRFDGPDDFTEDITITVDPGESRVGWQRAGLPLTADRYAWVESPDGLFPANRLFFAEIKDLPLDPKTFTVTAETTGPTTARLTLAASGFTYFAHALSPAPGTRFSDNYLDLRPGQHATIDVTGLPPGFDPATFDVRSFADVAGQRA